MVDDASLLGRYAAEGAEDAFRELVHRRFGLVYAVALRQVGDDEHLACDVAQRVFLEMARRAAALSRRPAVSGWLYRTARFTAIDAVRTERRRRLREQAAALMQETSMDSVSDAAWKNIRPVLDDALSQLKEHDRDAIMMRVIEDRSFAEIGRILRLTENNARMRVDRALEKLRAALRRRGITSTTAGLTVALANQAVATVPTGLPASIATEALAGAKVAGTTLVAGGLGFMSTTKTAGALIVALAAIAVGVGTYEAQAARRTESSQIALNHSIEALRARRTALTRELEKPDTPPPANRRNPASVSSGPVTAAPDAVTAAEIQRMNDAYENSRRLRTSNPQYQQLFDRATRAGIRLDYANFVKKLGLTPTQIEAFETLLTQRMWATVDLDGAKVALGLKPDDSVAQELAARADGDFYRQLQSLLGPAGYEQFRQTEALAFVDSMVGSVAGDVYYTDTPLTAAQGEQLSQIIARHDPHLTAPNQQYRRDGVEWAPILAEARPLLSPAQFEALQGLATQTRWAAESFRLLNQMRNQR